MVQTLGRCALPQPENHALGPLSPYLLPDVGKNHGIVSLIFCSSAKFVGSMVMRFAEYENWKSFSTLLPIVFHSLDAAIRLASSPTSSITPRGIMPPPKPDVRRPEDKAS